jgi:hypothetical protein
MSLRIHKPSKASGGDTFDKWMERLVKLIPGEIVPVYTLVREQGNDLWMTIIWPLIFLVLTFVFRAFMTVEKGKGPQWISAGISSVAFIFWVYITGGNFFGWVVDAGIMSGLMLVFMLIISKWWQGD